MYQAMGRYGNQRQRPRQSSINKRAISIFNNAPKELILELRSWRGPRSENRRQTQAASKIIWYMAYMVNGRPWCVFKCIF